ncbi:MAG: hypothetical protein L3J32_03330 [Rhizobiaceae bacterium]|nr:hypothetical protein [Rhizobiaceae bacterium]
MEINQLVKTIKNIRRSNPENLMARHFDAEYFHTLDDQSRRNLYEIIKTGIDNPDSTMGAYAQNPDDYDQFSQLLDPMIREFHGIDPATSITQKHDWNTSASSCNLASIDLRLKDVSMRVRVARNVTTFPLPGSMNKNQRVEFENLAARAFAELSRQPEFGGKYLSITPGSANEINAEEYEQRISAHQMFKDMSNDPYLKSAGISNDWPHGRGMYVSDEEDFLVWVGEEDHLRIMTMQRGGNLNAMFERLGNGIEMLSTLLPPFASSAQYGNVTSCPTNLGTAMRASLHMKLPRSTSNGKDISTLKSKAQTLGLAVRGAGGEHSDAGKDGLVDISPVGRLGITEMQIMQRLYDGAAQLWLTETSL